MLTWPQEPKSRRIDLAAGADTFRQTWLPEQTSLDRLTRPSEPKSLDGSTLQVQPRSLDGLPRPLELRSLDGLTNARAEMFNLVDLDAVAEV